MSENNLILLFICLLNPSLILMLNLTNEYFLDTCCSLDKSEKIYLSCNENEKIHLNLIEIFYNSNEYCSSELNCCKYRTNCSRRITKYSSLNCDEKNSCWIDKSCLKIHQPCTRTNDGLYGQYITINYSCLKINNNKIPFLLKFLISDQTTKPNEIIQKNFFLSNQFKSSPLFLISIIFTFVLVILFIYYLADQFGKKISRQNNSKQFQNSLEEKEKVSSNKLKNLSLQHIYPYNTICQCQKSKYPYIYVSRNPYEKYLHIEYDPTNRLFYSTTSNSYFNHSMN